MPMLMPMPMPILVPILMPMLMPMLMPILNAANARLSQNQTYNWGSIHVVQGAVGCKIEWI